MKSKLIKIFTILIAVTFIITPMSTAKADVDLEKTKEGVVRIVAQYDLTDGSILESGGSGFFIGEEGQPVQYIVTNFHVVSLDIEGSAYYADRIYLFRGNDDYIELDLTSIQLQDTDIVVLKLPEKLYNQQTLTLRESTNAKIGDKVYCLGFPGASDYFDGSISGKPEDVTITTGIISKIAETSNASTVSKNTEYYQIDATINHGNSGGPLIDENGYVIGINTFGLTDEEIYAAIKLDELLDALDARGFIYDKVVDGEAAQTVITNQPEAAAQPESNSSNGINWTMIAIIAGIVLVAVVVLIVVLLGRNKAPAQPKINQAVPSTVNIKAPKASSKTKGIVFGVNGTFSGKNIEVTSKIYIGRSGDCHVKYDANAKGISSKHCSVEFNGKEFTLTDVGSTYGTFLGDGQKLVPKMKYTLNNGDKFYLASNEELFQVSIIDKN